MVGTKVNAKLMKGTNVNPESMQVTNVKLKPMQVRKGAWALVWVWDTYASLRTSLHLLLLLCHKIFVAFLLVPACFVILRGIPTASCALRAHPIAHRPPCLVPIFRETQRDAGQPRPEGLAGHQKMDKPPHQQ